MPNQRNTTPPNSDFAGWAIGGLLALLFAGAVLMYVNSDGPNATSNNAVNRPSPTAPPDNPPSTTGAGTTSPAIR